MNNLIRRIIIQHIKIHRKLRKFKKKSLRRIYDKKKKKQSHDLMIIIIEVSRMNNI